MGQPSSEDNSGTSPAQPLASIAPVVNDHETDKARQARMMYALMDPGARSAKAVAEAVGCAVLTVEKWSSKYRWKEFTKRSDNAAYQRALTRVETEREETHVQTLRAAQQQVGRNLAPVIDKARDIVDLPSTLAIPVKDKDGKLKKDATGKVEVVIVPTNVAEHKAAADMLKTVTQITTALLPDPGIDVRVQVQLPDWLTQDQLDAIEGGGEAAQKVIKMIMVRGQYEPEGGRED